MRTRVYYLDEVVSRAVRSRFGVRAFLRRVASSLLRNGERWHSENIYRIMRCRLKIH